MLELQKKYAKVLLESCLKIEKGQSLLISFDLERIDFVRIVAEIALEMGITDIYYDGTDPYLKKEALEYLELDELKELSFWNKEIWNTYAEKNAAFLFLVSENPGLMKGINPKKLAEITKYSLETRKVFIDKRDKSMIPWCIAAIPSEDWAKVLYPNSKTPVEDLWNQIFDICYIREKNPVKLWNEKIATLNARAKKLNQYQFKTLKYHNEKGTNLTIDLPPNHIWKTAKTILTNGKEVLENLPTEEIFTSPDCTSANGVVYATKPLVYQDIMIENFSIEFQDGKVIAVKAEKGEEMLKEITSFCENSNRIGEVSLVPCDSPISNANQIFLETLFDENASCHLALGDSFPECIQNGTKIAKTTLFEDYHLNKCDSHVDFMVGSIDLNIIGITKNGEEISIFKNGNFTKEFQ